VRPRADCPPVLSLALRGWRRSALHWQVAVWGAYFNATSSDGVHGELNGRTVDAILAFMPSQARRGDVGCCVLVRVWLLFFFSRRPSCAAHLGPARQRLWHGRLQVSRTNGGGGGVCAATSTRHSHVDVAPPRSNNAKWMVTGGWEREGGHYRAGLNSDPPGEALPCVVRWGAGGRSSARVPPPPSADAHAHTQAHARRPAPGRPVPAARGPRRRRSRAPQLRRLSGPLHGLPHVPLRPGARLAGAGRHSLSPRAHTLPCCCCCRRTTRTPATSAWASSAHDHRGRAPRQPLPPRLDVLPVRRGGALRRRLGRHRHAARLLPHPRVPRSRSVRCLLLPAALRASPQPCPHPPLPPPRCCPPSGLHLRAWTSAVANVTLDWAASTATVTLEAPGAPAEAWARELAAGGPPRPAERVRALLWGPRRPRSPSFGCKWRRLPRASGPSRSRCCRLRTRPWCAGLGSGRRSPLTPHPWL